MTVIVTDDLYVCIHTHTHTHATYVERCPCADGTAAVTHTGLYVLVPDPLTCMLCASRLADKDVHGALPHIVCMRAPVYVCACVYRVCVCVCVCVTYLVLFQVPAFDCLVETT